MIAEWRPGSDLPVPNVGEYASAFAVASTAFIPYFYVLRVSIQVGGGYAPYAQGERYLFIYLFCSHPPAPPKCIINDYDS